MYFSYVFPVGGVAIAAVVERQLYYGYEWKQWLLFSAQTLLCYLLFTDTNNAKMSRTSMNLCNLWLLQQWWQNPTLERNKIDEKVKGPKRYI